MRTNAKKNFYAILLIVSGLFYSCGKSIPDPELIGEHQIRFQVDGFSASVTPLPSNDVKGAHMLAEVSGKVLYHWSFNQESLHPDLAIDKSSIVWNIQTDRISYVAGKALKPYEAGKALSVRGISEFTLGISIKDVKSLGELAFHISGSDTGPKKLDLSYSKDDGATYLPLLLNFDFSDVKSTSWGDVIQDLSSIDLSGNVQKLVFKFILKNASNPTTGTFKIDNFRMQGEYDGHIEEGVPAIRKLHYYIFNQNDGGLVASGEAEVASGSTQVELPVALSSGRYLASFVLNQSTKALILPKTIKTIDDFYIYNSFENFENNVYGGVMIGLDIDGDQHVPITLRRYYSEIRFEFTDVMDLAKVANIEIVQEHILPYYVPFGNRVFSTLTDATKVSIPTTFGPDNRFIQFNQFLGDLDNVRDVAYLIRAYDRDKKVLREFSVSSAIKNNVQLTFKGNLLDGIHTDGKFVINLDEAWGGDVEQPF